MYIASKFLRADAYQAPEMFYFSRSTFQQQRTHTHTQKSMCKKRKQASAHTSTLCTVESREVEHFEMCSDIAIFQKKRPTFSNLLYGA